MSRVNVNSDLPSMADWIIKWANDRHYYCRHDPSAGVKEKDASSFTQMMIKATTIRYSILWQLHTVGNRTDVTMTTRIRSHLSVALNLVIMGILVLVIRQIAVIVEDYALMTLMHITLLSGLLVVLILYIYHYLFTKLTALEIQFWYDIQGMSDVEYITRPEAQIEPAISRIITELVMAMSVIIICSLIGGIYGFIIAACIVVPFVLILLIYFWKNTHLQWHWQFWIIGNMSRWIFIMLCVLAPSVILMAFEVFLPLGLYKAESHITIVDTLHNAQFRSVYPPSAAELEKDAMSYIIDLSESTAKNHPEEYRSYLYFNAISMLFINGIAVLLFIFIPFSSLLMSRKRWRMQGISNDALDVPSVPYLAESWNWNYPLALRAFIVFHYLFGGSINIAATLFSVDSLSYALVGKSVILPQIVNLWSWVFASTRIVFGDGFGNTAGILVIIASNMPILFLFTVYFQRIVKGVLRAVKTIMIPGQQTNTLSDIQSFVKHICSLHGLKMPTIVLNPDRSPNIQLYYLPLINRSIIELSHGTIALLTDKELRAAIAHEIGHIKQGPWKIGVLKFLSSLALFPNYYLTLCMDWAKKEIDADRFAVLSTQDAQSLKYALIKISTAQIKYHTYSPNDLPGFVGRPMAVIRDRLHSVLISIQFFFGDGLFGYVHPYLSERLKTIDNL